MNTMRLIDADALHKAYMELRNFKQDPQSGDWISLRAVPLTTVIRMINEAPTIEPKRGEWEEKEVFHNGDDEPIVEEWQSARCSVCHKYHTTPYMYYFNDYNFCPNCGADMRGKGDE